MGTDPRQSVYDAGRRGCKSAAHRALGALGRAGRSGPGAGGPGHGRSRSRGEGQRLRSVARARVRRELQRCSLGGGVCQVCLLE
eukprot:6797090-Pyramimonas_sp.AAC.1